ncbi:MAG: DUF4349 domain-containing protein [Deltaproteobacteria bacterium]|nr:DUF4349 domain-containing protein [Deltaproteobacteria bacterium]
MARLRLRWLLALGLLAPGCMKGASARSFEAPGDAGGTVEAEYADADYASSDDAPSMTSREMKKSARRERSADRSAGDESYAPAPVMAAPAGKLGEVAPATPAVEEPRQALDGRMIIYTGAMHLSVFNLQEAMDKAEALPERYGGYVHSMEAGSMVLKIPAKHLRVAMKELAEYGVVEARSLSTQDVGAEYTDMESRVRALEGTHKQLLELLSKARTVDEALHVRQALDQVSAELEVLKGRMRQIDSLVAFSTLTLTMYERGPNTPTPSSNDPFPWVDSLGVEATEWK